MTKLVTSGSVGGIASNGCLYPDGDYRPSLRSPWPAAFEQANRKLAA
jgi:hypothetical protein